LVFDSGNAAQLADKIRMMYHQPELRREMGKHGHLAVVTKHNWPTTARELISVYDTLVEETTAPV
jgi:glycosyltransferase involved in cell wall biosynthesis